jgi:gliding motility-associated-like protein
VTINALDDASFVSNDFCASSVNTITGVVTPGGTFTIAAQTGSGAVTINPSTGILSNYVVGDQVTIEYTTAGACPNSSTQVVNVTNLDDASFVSNDFCESGVNTISGVVTPGGTFTISAQTGSGSVTIDASTGVLSNFVAGDQVTIEYTTAGACSNSSTQVVTVLPLDDAAFASNDFCESGVNTISGVATPGGTFAISAQTGSGSVTIDPSTGVLSNFVAGDQVTIEYTTGGACPNSSTQVVDVLPLDDASFFLTPTCDGATATITGTAGGSFVLLTATSATIDATTGTVTGAAYNEILDIEYTTTGSCPNSSVEIVTVDDCTPQDIIIPTAFTPEGDGTHDTWEIDGIDTVYPNARIMVFNRWGNKVFEHTSSPSSPYSNNMWDGTFNGQPLPVASYFYIIETNEGNTEPFEGTVTILK